MEDNLDDIVDENLINHPTSDDNIINQRITDKYNRKRGFAIRKIVIHNTCEKNILKILKPGKYIFSDSKYDGDNFFLEGVTFCSIVGKNGCGKSSLIELLFRMINNLGAMLFKNSERPAAEKLYFIDGVEADLYYRLNNKQGILCCKNDSVSLDHDGYSFVWSKQNKQCIYRINGKEQKENDFVIARNVAKHFFYLVATNYSMQAYINTDYISETIYSWQAKKNERGLTSSDYDWLQEKRGSWINSVFHKNDGYMCPIVLNPYRTDGRLDMTKEAHLTMNRLCALLLQLPDDYQIIEGYRLAYIVYNFNPQYLLDKFDQEMLKDIPGEKVIDKFFYTYYVHSNSYAKAILDKYGFVVHDKMNHIELSLRLYLVYKTFSIAEKYPQYGHFKSLGNVNNTFKYSSIKQELQLAKDLAERINQRNTHIELKIHQTIDWIRKYDRIENKLIFDTPLTYERINKLFGTDPHCRSVFERMNTLPPPLFEPTIHLIKNEIFENNIKTILDYDGKQKSAKNTILLSELSSGERQFIYTTSSLLYHAFNIQSIPNNERVAYRNLCLVLEEVEICFHPEYQRTFINNLIKLFKRTELNRFFGIFVIVVTHSPFVLSDIPKENILYLDDGHNVTSEKHLNTFGANVNELLSQSFFLSGGFMGEFAKTKIESLVNYLENDANDDTDDFWTEKKAKELIELVGDEVIQHQLRILFANRFKDSDFYRNWIASEAKRLGIES